MRKSQIEKLDALLLEIGYSSRRRKTGISYIQGFFEQINKPPKDIIEGDIRGYLATTKNCHLKFWVSFFYNDLLIHFYYHKMSRGEKQAFIRKIGDAAMERAKIKPVTQKVEPDINFDKYALIVNSPCIGCLNQWQCMPESCDALTNFVMGLS